MTVETRLAKGREVRLQLRAERKTRRKALKAMGRTPTRRQWVYRVEPEVIWIPDWAQAKRVAELGISADYVWLSDRILARMVAQMDRDEGGKPKLDRFEVRRCGRCGLLRVGTMAAALREKDESAADGRDLPCGPECTVRYQQQRGRL